MKRRSGVLCLAVMLLGVATSFYAQEHTAIIKGITKEALEKRLQELEQGRANALATLQAYEGAIQECEHWLQYLEKQEKEQSDGAQAK